MDHSSYLIHLHKGNPSRTLILIHGVNSKDDSFGYWPIEKLGFDGDIYGLSWKTSLPSLFSPGFKQHYSDLCIQAKIAGQYLAEVASIFGESELYVLSYSIGSYVAFSFLQNVKSLSINQILLFNATVSPEYDFKTYSSKVSNGIINFYNPIDYVLISINLIARFFFNSRPKDDLFNPIGIRAVTTVTENYSVIKKQWTRHKIDATLNSIIRFNNTKFEYKTP